MSLTKEQLSVLKELREKGYHLLDCMDAVKKFTNLDDMLNFLDEKSIAIYQKRKDNLSENGRFFIKQNLNGIRYLRLLTETDFLANTKDFNELGEKLLSIIYEKITTNNTLNIEEIDKMIPKFKYNLQVKAGIFKENLKITTGFFSAKNGFFLFENSSLVLLDSLIQNNELNKFIARFLLENTYTTKDLNIIHEKLLSTEDFKQSDNQLKKFLNNFEIFTLK